MPLVAVSVTLWVPPVPGSGVPLRRPAADNVTPAGNVPAVTLTVGAGKPVITTLNEPALPTVKVVAFALVIAGAWLTINVKAWVPSGSTPFDAVKVRAYEPPVAAPGVPLNVPVSLPLSRNVTPAGNDPLTAIAGVGLP